ncbi:hydrolase [Lactobacillus johnsonii]|uniref:Hydrolase n=1 Tax=Lactobacillus johnsonii TaxID=33959 RepID=A0A267M7S4_LACJH|nr:C40 family peptidase [Lactobacillus johnsonii]PAB55661.1 hydrolase [Lactobacillus johnsonii]
MTIKSKVIKFTTAASFAVAGIATLSAAKLNSLSFNGTAQASTLQAPAKEIGVVKVNSKTGESVAVWNSYEDGKQQTGKYLPHQSSWKTYKKVKTVKGETWYNLGGNQWISSDNVEEEAPIAFTADLSAVATAVSQVPAANVNNAQQAATTTANTASVATTTPVQTNTAAPVQQATASVAQPAQQAATTTANTASVATTTPVQTNTAAPVQQATASVAQPAQQTATTAASTNTQAAPAKTYYVQTNTAATTKQVSTASTQSNTTYTAPAQNNTAAKPAQQQASSQAATTQTAKPQASTQSNSSTAQTVVSAAQSQIGKPYVWGATGPNAYDCSGLVQYAYSQAGKNVGRTTYQQAGAGQHISVSQAQAGDILMWGDYHDAIYVGNNQYVHAPQPGQNVTQASISSYFMPDYAIRVN